MTAVQVDHRLVAAFVSVVDEADRLRSDRVPDPVDPVTRMKPPAIPSPTRPSRLLPGDNRPLHAITERFYLLSEHPLAGRARDDDLGAGRRSFSVRRRYNIVYAVTADDDVLILRVAHGRQDLGALMRRGR
jgi:hypothetical protein